MTDKEKKTGLGLTRLSLGKYVMVLVPPTDAPSAGILLTASANSLLWEDPEYADAEVKLGSHTWKVHLCVICPQSEYFKKALTGPFKEGITKTVELADDGSFSRNDIDAMLRFLYSGMPQSRHTNYPIESYEVALYFQVEALQEPVVKGFERFLLKLIEKRKWIEFDRAARRLIRKSPLFGLVLEDILVEVTACNAGQVVHNSGIWDAIAKDHPDFTNKVLIAIVPVPKAVGSTIVRPLKRNIDLV